MFQQITHGIPGSKNKHESDIPTFSIQSTIEQYYLVRAQVIDELHNQGESELQSLLPEMTEKLCRKMEKRFILYGKVRLEKDTSLLHLNDQQWLDMTVELARYLLDEYQYKTDWNSLNTAVRLSEYLLNNLNVNTASPKGLAALLQRELQIIQQINAGPYV